MVVSNVGCEFENIIYARNANEIRFDHVPTLRHMSISSNNIFDVACLFSRASTVMCQVKFTFLIYFFPIAQAVLRRHSRHFLYTLRWPINRLNFSITKWPQSVRLDEAIKSCFRIWTRTFRVCVVSICVCPSVTALNPRWRSYSTFSLWYLHIHLLLLADHVVCVHGIPDWNWVSSCVWLRYIHVRLLLRISRAEH